MNDDEPGLFEIMRTCRAMRRLKPDAVPESMLVKLIEAAQQGPSGSNQQNSRWLVIRDQAIKNRVATLNRAAVEKYLSRRHESLNDLPEAESKSQRRILGAIEWQAEHMAEAPALIVACLAMRSTPAESFVAGIGAGGSTWPGVQNLLLAARGLGLGAALTTLGLSDRTAFKDAVGLPENVEPVCVVPVGYPIGNFGPVARRPVEDVVRWDTWS
nr:H501 [uncultured bacterium]